MRKRDETACGREALCEKSKVRTVTTKTEAERQTGRILLNVAAAGRGGAARCAVEFKSNLTRSWEQRVVVRFLEGEVRRTALAYTDGTCLKRAQTETSRYALTVS